ncbi:MAG: hypothetical protein WAX14_01470 [Rhodococcus sp. (in: high G+C Gram-positive bacteria)]|uniref:hypothetical protein n=1 Tax=Rhodococcus sp. TaxID=1831 RepID=UPI003BB55DD0
MYTEATRCNELAPRKRIVSTTGVRATIATIALLTTITAISACSPTDTTATPASATSTATITTTPGDYRVPDNMRNSTVVWSAEPGIDLLGEYGTLTRGAVEANDVALGGGLDASYPGYARAIDRKTVDLYTQLGSDDAITHGTAYYHIRGIEPTDNGFIAHTCEQISDIAYTARDGRYVRFVDGGDMASKIAFERTEPPPGTGSRPTPTAPGPDPVGETGRPQWQAPTYDVFAGWNIIRGGWTRPGHTLSCRPWGQQFATDAPDYGTATIRSDAPPDTLPAYPGW